MESSNKSSLKHKFLTEGRLWMRSDCEKAKKEFSYVLELNPYDFLGLLYIGRATCGLKEYRMSLKYHLKVLKMYPDEPCRTKLKYYVHLMLTAIYTKLKRLKKAEREIENSIDIFFPDLYRWNRAKCEHEVTYKHEDFFNRFAYMLPSDVEKKHQQRIQAILNYEEANFLVRSKQYRYAAHYYENAHILDPSDTRPVESLVGVNHCACLEKHIYSLQKQLQQQPNNKKAQDLMVDRMYANYSSLLPYCTPIVVEENEDALYYLKTPNRVHGNDTQESKK